MAYRYPLARPGEPVPERVDASPADIALAIACREDDGQTVARLLSEGGVDVNALVRLSKSWAGTPLILVGDPDIAELLIAHGAEVNTLYWGNGSDHPPFTALDSAMRSLRIEGDPYVKRWLERLVELLRRYDARTGAELSERGLVPERRDEAWLSRPIGPSPSTGVWASSQLSTPDEASETPDAASVEVPAPGERIHLLDELRRWAEDSNPNRRVLAMCELSTFDPADTGAEKSEWIKGAIEDDPTLAAIALRYQRVGVVVSWELLFQAMEDAQDRLGLMSGRWQGDLSDREFAARAYLSVTLSALFVQGDPSERLAGALGQMKLVEMLWGFGGFSDIASVAAEDGECTALRFLAAPDAVDFDALDPSSVWGASSQAKAAAVAVTCLEATRGLWVNQAFVLRQPLPSTVKSAAMRKKWATVIAGLRASRRPGCSAEVRHEAEAQFNRAIRDVRGHFAEERFLAPPSAADLMSSVGETGAAVYLVCPRQWMSIVSGSSAAWALVVTGEAISAVRLPLVDEGVLRDVYLAYMDASVQGSAEAQLTVINVLGWLSGAILGPVAPLLDGKQRLWWIPTGPFVGLPLSAASLVTTQASASADLDPRLGSITRGVAGPDVREDGEAGVPWTGGPSRPTALTGRIPPVQSIAATIASVAASQGIDVDVDSRQQISVLGVPDTQVRGWGPLHQVEAELRAVSDTWQDGDATLTVTCVMPAHGDELRAAMASSEILHFAGHATTEELVCSNEAVSLGELVQGSRTADYGTRAGHLAVLSACLSQGRSASQSEFPVAVAVQLAAFSHVIGSIVPVFDRVAIEFSQILHAYLKAAANRPDPAAAMAATVSDLRDKYPDQPAYWAGWVHTGP